MTAITLRYFAAARAAAGGLGEETVDCATPEAAFRAAARTHGPQLARVIDMSSYLLDGRSLGRDELRKPVTGAATVDVLPPFAGG